MASVVDEQVNIVPSHTWLLYNMSPCSEEPSILGMQTRESFLEWNDDYTIDGRERNRDHTPSRNPVIIEIVKSAPQLGKV